MKWLMFLAFMYIAVLIYHAYRVEQRLKTIEDSLGLVKTVSVK